MTTNDQVKTLVKGHAEGDDPQLYAVVMQVVAKAVCSGQSRFAQGLRNLVNDLREQSVQCPRIAAVVPFLQPKGEPGALLNVSYPDAKLSDLVLTDKLQERLTHVLLEQRQHDVFARHGLTPVRRLLLIGPLDTGKTSTVRVIAGELGLPLFSIRLGTVLTKFTGETATKLRLVFDVLTRTRGIYFFDEADALGGDRAAQGNVGEIRRVLSSFLQFLGKDTSDSVITAATNHPSLLDNALLRRFDTVMDFALFEDAAVKSAVKDRLVPFQIYNLSRTRTILAARGPSHAEIATVAENAAKRTILSGRTRVRTDDIIIVPEECPRPHQWVDRID